MLGLRLPLLMAMASALPTFGQPCNAAPSGHDANPGTLGRPFANYPARASGSAAKMPTAVGFRDLAWFLHLSPAGLVRNNPGFTQEAPA
jgi:hypothetical protein